MLDGYNTTAWCGPPTGLTVSNTWFAGRQQHDPTSLPHNATSAYTSNAHFPPPPFCRDGLLGEFAAIANGPTFPSSPFSQYRAQRAFWRKRNKDWLPCSEKDYRKLYISRRPRDWTQDFELHPCIVKKVIAPRNRSDISGILYQGILQFKGRHIHRIPRSYKAFSLHTPPLQILLSPVEHGHSSPPSHWHRKQPSFPWPPIQSDRPLATRNVTPCAVHASLPPAISMVHRRTTI